jgi:hypothetical protein
MQPDFRLGYGKDVEGDFRVRVYVGIEDLDNKNRSSVIKVHRSHITYSPKVTAS